MTLDDFIAALIIMPPQFVPMRTGEKLSYWWQGREVHMVQAVCMYLTNNYTPPTFTDACNELGLSSKDAAALINAEWFQFLPFPYGPDVDKLRVDIEIAMFERK